MKIALLVSGIVGHQRESLAITTINFAKELQRQGHAVVIVTQNKWKGPELETVEGIQFIRSRNLGNFLLYNKVLSYSWAFRRLNYVDIIHSFSASPALILRSILAKLLFARKAKVIHTLKSYPIKQDVKAKGRSLLLSRLGDSLYGLLNFADAITVPTEVHARRLILKGAKKSKITVVRSHVNLQKFYPKDKTELRNRYGYSKQRIVFNYGAMWEIKGTDYLLKCIPQIVARHPEALFLFAPRNAPASKQKYDRLILELGISGHVEFVSGDIAIEDYVNLADMAVFPYPHLEGTEGNPSCLLEALACATPVVTTDLPELREVFGQCVEFVKPGDLNSLASGITSVLKHDNQRKIAAGLELVKQFEVKKITREFLELYAKTK